MTGSRWHPFRELRAADQLLMFMSDELPSGNAWWSPAYDVIYLRKGILQVERRCALAHELGHRALRHNGQCRHPDAARIGQRNERDADVWAASRLITVEDLADALRWTSCPVQAAEELWVTRRLLEVRLARMSVPERRRLGELLKGSTEETA
jgi:Zn-dependent peptidase ImmA (M78 family)